MNKLLLTAGLIALPVASAWGESELYGRANVSFELVDEEAHSGTALRSNSSRLGIKGTHLLNDDYTVIYQAEYGAQFDDGEDGDDGAPFSQRNIFVGVQSEWGAVIGGHFDTPLKRAQDDVDLFNDLRGDIGKTISVNDNRTANTVMYSTPDSLGPFTANLAYISSESDAESDGKSVSVTYQTNALYAAVAMDQDVEADGADAARLVGAYRTGAWQLGGLVETSDTGAGGSDTGWLVSGLYTLDRWALKAQAGQSDILYEDATTLSLGADYKFSKAAKVYAFYTTLDAEESEANHYLGAGIELRF